MEKGHRTFQEKKRYKAETNTPLTIVKQLYSNKDVKKKKEEII